MVVKAKYNRSILFSLTSACALAGGHVLCGTYFRKLWLVSNRERRKFMLSLLFRLTVPDF
jgi:hypothetical protein